MQKARVKDYTDRLGKIMNEVKAFAQRQQEAAQAAQQNNGQDQEAMAKIQMDAMSAKQKLAIDAAKHQQKMQQKQQAFAHDQKRKGAELAGAQHRENVKTLSDVRRDSMLATVEAKRMAQESQTEDTE